MKQFKLSVHRYRLKLMADEEQSYGYADMVSINERCKRYAVARRDHNRKKRMSGLTEEELAARKARGDFNPFSGDKDCVGCKKKKAK